MIEKKPLNEPLLPPGVDDTSSPDPQVVKARALADPRALRRRIIFLSLPIFGENLLEMSLDIVNTILVAALGAAALAGAGAAIQIMQIVLSALAGLSTGGSILVAHAVGADNPAEGTRLARQALMWSFIIFTPMAVMGVILAPGLAGIFGLPPDATAMTASYLSVSLGAVPVLAMLMMSSGVLRGAGDARTPMYVTIGANVVNMVLAFVLIHGHWGAPELGVTGAAIASAISRTLALVVLVWLMARGRAGVSLSRPVGTILVSWKPRWDAAKAILHLGLPAAGEQLVISTAWLVFTMVVSRLGTASMAAQRVQMSVQGLVFLPALALMIATTTLVGQALGAGRPALARQVAGRTERWAFGVAVMLGVLVAIFAKPLVHVFTTAPVVVDIAVRTLPVMMLAQPFWAFTIQNSGALRAMRAPMSPLIVEAISNWTVVVIAWIIVSAGGGLTAAWFSFVIMAAPTSLAMMWRKRVEAQRLAV